MIDQLNCVMKCDCVGCVYAEHFTFLLDYEDMEYRWTVRFVCDVNRPMSCGRVFKCEVITVVCNGN